MRLAISFLRTHKLLSSGEAGSLPRLVRLLSLPACAYTQQAMLCQGQEAPGKVFLCRTPARTDTITGASFLGVEHLLSSSDLYSEYLHGVKSRDRTKEAHGHPEAEEERKVWGIRSGFHQLPRCPAIQPSDPHSTPEHVFRKHFCAYLPATFSRRAAGVPVQSFLSYQPVHHTDCVVSPLLVCSPVKCLPHRVSVGMGGGEVCVRPLSQPHSFPAWSPGWITASPELTHPPCYHCESPVHNLFFFPSEFTIFRETFSC